MGFSMYINSFLLMILVIIENIFLYFYFLCNCYLGCKDDKFFLLKSELKEIKACKDKIGILYDEIMFMFELILLELIITNMRTTMPKSFFCDMFQFYVLTSFCFAIFWIKIVGKNNYLSDIVYYSYMIFCVFLAPLSFFGFSKIYDVKQQDITSMLFIELLMLALIISGWLIYYFSFIKRKIIDTKELSMITLKSCIGSLLLFITLINLTISSETVFSFYFFISAWIQAFAAFIYPLIDVSVFVLQKLQNKNKSTS